MTQMSNSQVRVIDPILSTAAQGYRNADFVGMALFPYVPVAQRGGNIISFGKEDFALYNTARSPGANTKRVQFGYSGSKYALDSHSLEGQVPFEHMQDASQVPGIDLGNLAVAKVQNIIGLRLEKAQADLATTAGNYGSSNKITLSGTSQWSDYGSTSDPIGNVEAGRDAVRAKIGKRPNIGVIGAAVYAYLKNHPKVIDRLKYTGRDSATPKMLAEMFGLDALYVGDGIYDNNGTFADVWGKFCVLAYTEKTGLADQGLPTYGYTYRMTGYPLVEQPYQDRNAKSWIYPVDDEVQAVIAGASGGYLISGAVA